jgi:hypothetical protein
MSRGSLTRGRGEPRAAEPTNAIHQPKLRAAIVSSSLETRDGLEAYLRGAGISTRGTSQLADLEEVAREASAIVMFPDDFAWEAVLSALRTTRENTSALVVLVTSRPFRFEALLWSHGSQEPMVVPKPAWGWTILDAIRAHLERDL